MAADDTASPPFPASPAWFALLRAELTRLGLPPEEQPAALAALPTPPVPIPTQYSVLSTQHSWRWGDRTLPLGARTLIMGVINVTDDSLSDDGLGRDVGAVLARAEALVADGADILDVGGESTRPGARAVPAAEERARVEPAVAAVARRLAVPISVDTRKAAVAEAALAAGAGAVNDVSGLRHDRAVAAVAARTGAALILGHWVPRATARSPQRRLQHAALPPPRAGESRDDLTPPAPLPSQGRGEPAPRATGAPFHQRWQGLQYSVLRGERSPVADVVEQLQESVAWALAAGCTTDQLAVDPGLGFGKAPRVSLALLRDLSALRALGLPLVVGPSRKGFIGRVLGAAEQHGWEGTAAAVALVIAGGADVVRVHDVARLARVVRMSDAIVQATNKS
jgi:dihydropteroate synthase